MGQSEAKNNSENGKRESDTTEYSEDGARYSEGGILEETAVTSSQQYNPPRQGLFQGLKTFNQLAYIGTILANAIIVFAMIVAVYATM